MAKRRKLEAPSKEDLGKIEVEFRRETSDRTFSAPIAQIAAEAADGFIPGTPELRRDEAQAAAYRQAEGQGRLIQEVPLSAIDAASIQRDRMLVDPEALSELEFSIQANGLRLPIEIYPLKNPDGGPTYGLISGYRRLLAFQNLSTQSGAREYNRIKAVVREPEQMGGAFVAMVEENEIRENLSHFERGRIAAIAAQQGAFKSTDAAIAEMFAAASKAKRSKIRSFAMIFEELGDVLMFPEALREKDGLRLAQALRNGAEAHLRDVLAAGRAQDAKAELALIERVLSDPQTIKRDPKRGGRPKEQADMATAGEDILRTRTGVTIRREADGKGYLLRFSGRGVSSEMMGVLMVEIKDRLEND